MSRKLPDPRRSALGNKNGQRARLFREGLKRALARAHGNVATGLDAICDKIVERATGDHPEARHYAEMVAERIDGKPHQTVEATISHNVIDLENVVGLSTSLSESLAKRTESTDGAIH